MAQRPRDTNLVDYIPTSDAWTQMIVADTGNNRLQVFHIDMLPAPHDGNTGIRAASKSYRGGGGRTFEGLSASSSVGDTPPSSRFPLAWTQSQVASPATNTSSGRRQKPSPPQIDAEGRRPGVLNPQQETSAAVTAAPDGVGDDASRACLLVFTGDENAGRLRKRRTAGESEAAEGPLCQPCDLAYWRPSGPGRRVEGHACAAWAWTPELPRWFRPHTGRGGWPGSSSDDVDDEDEARRELLPPAAPSQGKCATSRGDKNESKGPLSRAENKGHARGSVGGNVGGGGKPLLGAFMVRETGVLRKLQLLFVAKTKVQSFDFAAGIRC